MAILYCGNQKIAPVIIEDSGGGSTPSGTTDVPLTRISDDGGNEIGTHYMNFQDGNGNTFKVIVLDFQYTTTWKNLCSNSGAITNMPLYSNLLSSNNMLAKETATQNTQVILDWCSANGFTSQACTHCRSQSFTIGGVTYYGQLPNSLEALFIGKNYPFFNPPYANSFWSSTQYNSSNGLYMSSGGYLSTMGKTGSQGVFPVLEIPL